MKTFTRVFSAREKLLIAVLGILIVALLYYMFVERPVKEGIAVAPQDFRITNPKNLRFLIHLILIVPQPSYKHQIFVGIVDTKLTWNV